MDITYFEIEDFLGDTWVWNGERVYLQEAEAELGEDNGYQASTLGEAIVILFENASVGRNSFFKTTEGNRQVMGA